MNTNGTPIDPTRLLDVAESLWIVLANVSGGDWTKQSPEWQEAAARFRDDYHRAIGALTDSPVRALVAAQPLALVEWVDRDELVANDYNPNHVAPPEYELLRTSIMEDGWTQPIVCRPKRDDGKREIVDGFHRWSVSADPDVTAPTGGKVPVVTLRASATRADQMLATVRHNRARGAHGVLKMADIVLALLDAGMDRAEIERRLGMEAEEIDRLSDQRGMPTRGGVGDFGKGWTPE